MLKNKIFISITFLFIFHLVAIVGIGFGLNKDMIELSWMNLLLTALIVFYNKNERTKKFIFYSAFVFTIGLLVEIIGVATGFPFGNYKYGNSLGSKIFEVPIVLGLNWWILIYSSIHSSRIFTKHIMTRIFLAPFLMLGLDLLIEQLCSKLDFWHWHEDVIPFKNYVSWYIISLALIALYFYWIKPAKTNKVAIASLVIQFLFFAVLNLIL